jgi:hypothetical protein
MHVPSTSNSSLTSVLPGMLEYYSALELLSGAELTWEVAVRLHLYTGRASAPIVRGNNAAIDRSISASDARLGCRRVVARARGHETGCTVLGPTPDPWLDRFEFWSMEWPSRTRLLASATALLLRAVTWTAAAVGMEGFRCPLDGSAYVSVAGSLDRPRD